MTRRASLPLLLLLAACSKDEGTPAPADQPADAAPAIRVSGLPQTCTRGAKNTEKPATCNGSAALCDRTYDRAVTPMTHNAMSNADDGWHRRISRTASRSSSPTASAA